MHTASAVQAFSTDHTSNLLIKKKFQPVKNQNSWFA